MIRIFLCSLLALFLPMAALAFPGLNEKDKQEAEALIAAAANAVDIRQDPAKPFELKARILTKDLGEGTYILEWHSRDKWRETIMLSKSSQIRVRNGDQSWTQRNPVVPPEVFSEVANVLGLTNPLIASPVKVDSVKNVSADGRAMKCIRVSQKGMGAIEASHREECVEVSTGLLAQRKELSAEEQVVGFGDYVAFETRHFPGTIRSTHGGTTVEIRLEGLKTSDFDGTRFAGVAGVEPWTTCDNTLPPSVINPRDPEYSESARQKKIQGTVVLLISVGAEGKVHDSVVVKSLETSLDAESLKTVRSWSFKPARCGDKPVPFEIHVEMEFRLGS